MELRTTREMRRSEQLNRTLAKKTEGEPAKAQPAQPKAPADKLSLSAQALAYLDERQSRLTQELEERQAKQHSLIQGYLDAMETEEKKLDRMNKALDTMDKCNKIAASIMKGNRVPPEDLAYLMKNDPNGYKLAMAMRRQNPDPEDEKSVLSDEDKNGGSVEDAESGEAPEVSAPEASSGGGDAAPAE